MIYGRVFDASCILWEGEPNLAKTKNDVAMETNENSEVAMETDAGTNGACLLYELTNLRRGFIGVTLALQV